MLLKKDCALFILILSIPLYSTIKTPKIVGLIPVRNESIYIDQCLRALALYTDAIIVLDDASTDNTLKIVESLQHECTIERIITKKYWHRDEPGDRMKMLQAGRDIGGTHFIVLDADEMLTATCLKDNFLRNKILAMQPGDQLKMHWIRLWKNIYTFRQDADIRTFIFCDDGISDYSKSRYIHVSRHPTTLKEGSENILFPIKTFGVLHFQSVNWRNMQVRQAWYRCLEHIRKPNLSSLSINRFYNASEDENDVRTLTSPRSWFDYDFFNAAAYEAPEQWREQEIVNWFELYDKNYFADLDIWHINWGEGL